MEFRNLRADEIELRVGQVYESGVSFLLYKDARCDMNILDECVGAVNWQRSNKEVKGNLYCAVGIYDEAKKEWIFKEDCGTESNTEKEKGESSDAFKRACVNWGIGRELYTAPLIYFKCETVRNANGRYQLKDARVFRGIYVKEIEVNSRKQITKLIIAQRNGGKESEIYKWTRE